MARLGSHIWRTSTLTALVILLAMGGLGLFIATQLHTTWHNQLERRLLVQVQGLAQEPFFVEAVGTPAEQSAPVSQTLAQSIGQVAALMGGSVVVTDGTGRVRLDSQGALTPGTDLSRMPEVRAALANGPAIQLRSIGELGATTYFIAAPVYSEGEQVGVVRLALPYGPFLADYRPLQWLILAATLATTLVMAALAIFLTERDVSDLRRLSDFARQIAAGRRDLPHLLSINSPRLAELAHALNRTSDRLKSQMKKRAREKDRLVTIIHVMTDGVIILNNSGRVRLLNPAAERILQTTQERALGRTFVQTARDHRIAELWERCQNSGEEIIATVELGAHQYVRVAMTPFLKRTARGYLVILDDLTEVRRLQTIRQDFVSNVSHELRTPLASLRALVETLRDGAMDDPPAAHRFLDRMEVEVDALTQMVAELLELSRIESGQVPLQLARCKPADILGIGAERLRPQTERASINLVVDIPQELPEVIADTTRIQQVVTNLVHNAIKFTPPKGTIRMTADLDLGEEPATALELNAVASPRENPAKQGGNTQPARISRPRILVKVQDTGMGIPETELSRVFERFYKTDRSRAMGGTGLGLAISKHIVQAHGGEIWVESNGKHGSIFFFTLPVAEQPGPTAPQPSTESSIDTPPGPIPANGAIVAKNSPYFG